MMCSGKYTGSEALASPAWPCCWAADRNMLLWVMGKTQLLNFVAERVRCKTKPWLIVPLSFEHAKREHMLSEVERSGA